MSPMLTIWTVIVVVGFLNYLSRLSFIALFSRRSMPSAVARALKYVPAAMLTALVVPMIVTAPVAGAAVHLNPRIWAALVAAVVAFRTGSTLPTLAAGMATLWVLQATFLPA